MTERDGKNHDVSVQVRCCAAVVMQFLYPLLTLDYFKCGSDMLDFEFLENRTMKMSSAIL